VIRRRGCCIGGVDRLPPPAPRGQRVLPAFAGRTRQRVRAWQGHLSVGRPL